MTRAFGLLLVSLLVLLAGCKSTGPKPDIEWGDPYADVVVPGNYEAHDNPPFKRQDGSDGKRIYARYAYRSNNGLDKASRVAAWLKENLPKQGWKHQVDEADEAKGLLTARYIKGDDKLQVKLAPDKVKHSEEGASVLTIEINGQYDN